MRISARIVLFPAAAMTALAGISPEEAKSNLAAWWELMPGIEEAPSWMTSGLDLWVFWIGLTMLSVTAVMAVTGWGTTTTVHLSWPFFRKSFENHQTERTQLVPDWKISGAMDYVAKELGSEIEQDVNAKYSGPAGLLTTKALAGEIQIWGKRLIAENKPELAQREIAPSEWNERELLIWACQPYTRKAQTRGVGQRATQQFTDLYVNESQIKEIPWRGENAYKVSQNADRRYDTPIHEAVDYVAKRIDDYNSDDFYPTARHALRRAAFEGQISMHGKKELEKGYSSKLRMPIPQEFWGDQELSVLTTGEYYIDHDHTQPEQGEGFKKLGRDREKYWSVHVSMDEVRKERP